MMEGAERGSYGLAHTKRRSLFMTIKSKLIPFFATGVLLSSVAALAQTRVNPDTGSSTGQASGMQPSTNSGDSTATTGDTMGAAPGVSSPDQSSGDSANTPASPSGDSPATSPQVNSPSSTDSSSTTSPPDTGASRQ